ncbi:MAG: hypothetical protein H6819_08645 [Phycisphaerales bacterium]|nr:hypothetical protein [Phycisphaerales bacterium]MCB9855701.1 hypothetical protein [Phycisphaerales bacterium]MCB9862596.1 hypothetical protein [Phycisphaerales bacterium]
MKTRRALVAALFVFVGCSKAPDAGQTSQPAAESSKPVELTIRWTDAVSELGLNTLDDLDSAMSQPVKLELDGKAPTFTKMELNGKPPEFGGEPIEQVQIVSCNDYYAMAGKPYAPTSDIDMQRLLPFIRTCDTLQLLKQAEPAKQSFVDDFLLSTDTIEEVLPLINLKQNLPSADPDNSAYISIEPEGPAEKLPDGRIQIRGLGNYTTVEQLAWADFDHDGLEDVLLHVHVVAGSLGYWSYHRAITRREPGGPLESVVVDAYTAFRR